MKVLTGARGSPNGHINPNAKLSEKNTIQDGRDPSVLPCDSVGSVTVRVSDSVSTDGEGLNL